MYEFSVSHLVSNCNIPLGTLSNVHLSTRLRSSRGATGAPVSWTSSIIDVIGPQGSRSTADVVCTIRVAK